MSKAPLPIVTKLLCLIFPIGIIVFFALKEKNPKGSKEALRMVLMGIGISLVLYLVSSLI